MKKEKEQNQWLNKQNQDTFMLYQMWVLWQNVYKIGMTRRLEPLDRVKELGDAGVFLSYLMFMLLFTL